MSTAYQDHVSDVETGRAAPGDIGAVAERLNATLAEPDTDEGEYLRAREAGIAWARDYATTGELRDLVENLKHGRYGAFDIDVEESDPHWRGFVDGAEEVLDTGGPPEDAPADADESEDFQYRRGWGDGIEWASEYATASELRDLVEHGADAVDDPHWRGFVDGAGDVLDAAGPLLTRPIPHDYQYFVKWLLEVAP